MNPSSKTDAPRQASDSALQHTYAAVDLGSNSFHMVVAEVGHDSFRIVDRIREPVRLAAGLDALGEMQPEVAERALLCLSRFGQRIRDLPANHVRVVGTSTLRKVSEHGNSNFLREAEQALGQPINIISGIEEARLIYNGVKADLGGEGRQLVIDIGGSSTELIVAHDGKTQYLKSLPLGCVVLTRRFADADGRYTPESLAQMRWYIASCLQPHIEQIRALGFDQVFGASGSVRAVKKIIAAEAWSLDGISKGSLEHLMLALQQEPNPEALSFEGLSDERKAVIHAGAFVLSGIFTAWGFERARVSGSALREGVLLEMFQRDGVLGPARDIRSAEVARMARQYHVDLPHANAVAKTAANLVAAATGWGFSLEDRAMLQWAAQLHELGLSVAHAKHHRHGNYLLRHSDLAGFARAEQLELATLVDMHRATIRMSDLDDLPRRRREAVRCLVVILRLAKLFNRSRVAANTPSLQLRCENQAVEVVMPQGWLEVHPLTAMDLEKEAGNMEAIGFALSWA